MSGHFESMDIVTAINGAEMTSDKQARELISQSHGDIRFTVRRDGSRPPPRARWAVAMSSATKASSGEAGVAVAGVGRVGRGRGLKVEEGLVGALEGADERTTLNAVAVLKARAGAHGAVLAEGLVESSQPAELDEGLVAHLQDA